MDLSNSDIENITENKNIAENENKYLEINKREKQNQYDALSLISNYISEVVLNNETDVENLKYEQNIIIKEMKKIQNELLDL
jgi:hypothetical protein